MITLHYNNTTIDIHEDDNSYRYRALMQKPQLVLKFSLPEYIEFPVGTWCEYQKMRFKVFSPQNIKKSGTRNIEYTITFGQDDEYMGLYKLRNSVDKRLKWSMCAKPHEFIEEIVKNLNEKEGADNWSVGDCIEANEQTIEFNHTYIDAALQSVADTFETEWEIVNKKISLHKVEYFKDDPLPLSYGKGNGFIPGLGRTSQSDELPIKRLYVQGGEDNIDRSKYGSQHLLLPKSQTIDYEGRTYKTDADGLYIERIDKVSDAVKEDSLDCDEFYPSRVGKVTKVEVPNKDKNFYDLIDKSIPSDLNYNDYIIAGETATLIFQSGMLAGREFEFKYKHAERRFELVPMEEDGQTFPNETFSPSVDDTYAIFGIMLPDSYICDNTTKTGASWDMFREAVKYMYEHEEQKFTFTGTLQGLWTKRNWLRVGGRLKVGGYILFSDTQFAKDGVSIRITGIKDYLSLPYSPTIELSSSISGSSVASDLSKIDKTEVVIDDTKKDIMQYTKRRFRDAKETISMLNDSLLNFSQSVSPITVQTMAMLVGDESLQFRFVESKSKLSPIEFLITYDNTTKQLHCPHGYLQHMTLGISTISSTHADSEYKVWEVAEYLSPVLDDDSKKYYLYAKVSRTDTNAKGEFTLSETAIDMDAVDGYYYLLVGILNSAYDDERSYVNLYGFTEILPSRITTDKVISADGKSWLDLNTGAMKLGDKFHYVDDTLYLDFLFTEGANIGGWVFRNGRLESQDGRIYLDGQNGKVRLQGTLQLSTAYKGVITDANVFYLPPLDANTTKTLSLTYDKTDIGKVIRFFNSSNAGGGRYMIKMCNWTQSYDQGYTLTEIGSTYYALIDPQETIEITCFERTGSTEEKLSAEWTLTGRFGVDQFKNQSAIGRFPRLVAKGYIQLSYDKGSEAILSGTFHDGRSINNVLSVKYIRDGTVQVTFSQSDIPNGYWVMVSGRGFINEGGWHKGCYASSVDVLQTSFVLTLQADYPNYCGFDFMIFAPYWEYNLKND